MSYFPIFLNLHEKPVLLVGGGKVAARKIRALRKAGAAVSVIAAELGDELRELDAEGGIDWIARRFEPALMKGFWLAIAATDDTAVNQAVYEAGEARNIPVNVVDDGAHCRFISPAVVDRAPVQIAISTGGASPMLARAIREWIENLLPQGLGRAAEAAGRLRREFGAKVSLISRRRAWQFLMERSRFVRWNSRGVEDIVKEMRGELHKRVQGERAGQVYLVGAGPGRAELLTLRAVEVLQEADVIFHDRLVSPEILERARRDAELVDVGKRAGRHQGVQQRIFELMVEAAREGKTVVRLKGGDAFVFGRGGEELEYLRDNGIEYEVVPGITAALGCAAYAGIPLTHRDYAHQLTIATGHLAGPEWTGVPNPQSELPANVGRNPRSGETLVVYMGVKQATSVRAKLMERGFSETTPAALIINGTMDAQRVLHGTVSTLPAMAAQVADGAPGLFIIGQVAALGQELAWFKGMSKLQAAA